MEIVEGSSRKRYNGMSILNEIYVLCANILAEHCYFLE